MPSGAARLAAILLLAIAAIELVQGDRFALPVTFADERVVAYGVGDVSFDGDECFSCAAFEGAAPQTSLAMPLPSFDRMPCSAGSPRPGTSSAPYHPPR